MGFELELAIVLALQLLGTEIFCRFEIETPAWRKILKWLLLLAITFALFQYLGHWAILLPVLGSLAGVAFHFVWCKKNGIHPIRATPRRKYYQLRGWAWQE